MALPHYAYFDPARIVESNELHQLGCKGCARAEFILGLPLCPNQLKYPSCRRHDRGYKLSEQAGGQP